VPSAPQINRQVARASAPLLATLSVVLALLLATPSLGHASDLAFTAGLSLLEAAGNGSLQLANGSPAFARPSTAATDTGAAAHPVSQPDGTAFDPIKQAVALSYSWGRLSCAYRAKGDTLAMAVTLANSSPNVITSATVQVAELTFPVVPTGDTADPGMWGTNAPHPLNQWPLTASTRDTPPVLLVDFGSGGVMDFCDDGLADPVTLSIPYSANQPANTRYPLWAAIGPVGPGKAETVTLSLRFAPPGSSATALARDVYRTFALAHPFRLAWKDHRALGTSFLSTSEHTHPNNPRGWFNNDASVDTTTPAGIARFRKQLMDYADASVAILKDMNAQGVVTWDIEGQEFSHVTYYGDPRLEPRLAPEMEAKDDHGVPAIDAYFGKFRAAGLRYGVCIRPQEISFENGVPVQHDSQDPAATIVAKIRYAKQRWGCTLFYLDSSVDARGNPLDPAIIEKVTQTFPDILLMPENQTTRYYDCSAPFDTFFHHGALGTPAGLRAIYPKAFTALYAPDDGSHGTVAANFDKLTAAVRSGDILMFHSWYNARVNQELKAIYAAAAPGASHSP
jgi:hypothetical protein